MLSNPYKWHKRIKAAWLWKTLMSQTKVNNGLLYNIQRCFKQSTIPRNITFLQFYPLNTILRWRPGDMNWCSMYTGQLKAILVSASCILLGSYRRMSKIRLYLESKSLFFQTPINKTYLQTISCLSSRRFTSGSMETYCGSDRAV